MTRKYSPCWIRLNSDKRLLFAVENKKKLRIFPVKNPKFMIIDKKNTIVGLGGFLPGIHHHDDNHNLFLSCMNERGEGSFELSGVIVGHPHGEACEQQ